MSCYDPIEYVVCPMDFNRIRTGWAAFALTLFITGSAGLFYSVYLIACLSGIADNCESCPTGVEPDSSCGSYAISGVAIGSLFLISSTLGFRRICEVNEGLVVSNT